MLNSACAAAFISGRRVGAARSGLPSAAARKKNELHRAPLLKSPLGGSARGRGGRNGAEGGARGGATVTRRRLARSILARSV